MLLDLAQGACLERSFEVLGDELHELLARDLVNGQVESASRVSIVGRARVVHLSESPCLPVRYASAVSRYSSRISLSRERPRCNRTRWFSWLRSRSSHTSSAE